MKNKSLWISGIKDESCKSLDKNICVDVLIIGGGLTGISTAFNLKDSKLNIALIESDKIGFGVSSKTTGKLTYLQELIYNKLESNFNYDTAKKYLDSQIDAINIVKENVSKYNIKCDFVKNSSYTFTNNDKEITNFKKEEKILKKANIKYEIINKLTNGYNCKYAIKVDDTYVFHPIKYIISLKNICIKNGIKIYEDTTALKLKKESNHYICETKNNKIKAKWVVVATHYPFFVIQGLIPLKTHIEKSYISASITNDIKDFNVITNSYQIKSIRYPLDKDKYIIFATNSHKLCDNLDRKKEYNKMVNEVHKSISRDIKFIWTNQDIMTNDNLPFIGVLNKNEPNLLIGTGYNTWGMTNATIAGKVLSDIILGNKNRYIDLFDPNRKFSMDKIKNFFVNSYLNGKAYVVTKLKKNYPWYENKVRFENRNGVNVGIYTDEKGNEHIVRNLCPHMKCSLIFNMKDKTWDCPCHGSRFDIDGNVVEGPSVYGIKVKEKR